MTAQLLQQGVDRLFLPNVRTFESLEPHVHATTCPITQGLPYFLRCAMDIPEEKILRPILEFHRGKKVVERIFADTAESLGFRRNDGRRSFRVAMERQEACWKRLQDTGAEALRFNTCCISCRQAEL